MAKFLKLAGLSLRARFTFPATRKSRSSFGLDHVPSRFRFTPSLQAEAKKTPNSSMRVEINPRLYLSCKRVFVSLEF
jgi:hypothetical protein